MDRLAHNEGEEEIVPSLAHIRWVYNMRCWWKILDRLSVTREVDYVFILLVCPFNFKYIYTSC